MPSNAVQPLYHKGPIDGVLQKSKKLTQAMLILQFLLMQNWKKKKIALYLKTKKNLSKNVNSITEAAYYIIYINKYIVKPQSVCWLSRFGRDEKSMKVYVNVSRDGGPGHLLQGFGIEDEHEGRNVGIRRNNRRQDHSCKTENRNRTLSNTFSFLHFTACCEALKSE